MKIYVVNGRKVWLDKAPDGYEEVKTVIDTTEEKIEEKAKPAPANKARKARANKSRKAENEK